MIDAVPTTFRYVSCWPAEDAVGRSSAVALERTAKAAGSPIRVSGRVIPSTTSPGTVTPSMDRRMSALSLRIPSPSSGPRRES